MVRDTRKSELENDATNTAIAIKAWFIVAPGGLSDVA
jgi:hypothetical protein